MPALTPEQIGRMTVEDIERFQRAIEAYEQSVLANRVFRPFIDRLETIERHKPRVDFMRRFLPGDWAIEPSNKHDLRGGGGVPLTIVVPTTAI